MLQIAIPVLISACVRLFGLPPPLALHLSQFEGGTPFCGSFLREVKREGGMHNPQQILRNLRHASQKIEDRLYQQVMEKMDRVKRQRYRDCQAAESRGTGILPVVTQAVSMTFDKAPDKARDKRKAARTPPRAPSFAV